MQSDENTPAITLRPEVTTSKNLSTKLNASDNDPAGSQGVLTTSHTDIPGIDDGDVTHWQEDSSDDEDFEAEESVAKRAIPIDDNYLIAQNGRNHTCTLAEATEFRSQLNRLGAVEFLSTRLDEERCSARKLVTAFRYRIPAVLEDAPDEACYDYLLYAMGQHLTRRYKLPQYNTLDDAATLIKKSKNIMVITGAGISTSLGIPDFRSQGGLYDQLREEGLDVDDPQEVFDIDKFYEAPHIFFGVAKKIIVSLNRVSPTHAFIKLLHDQGKLLTNYTQNIDNLEELAGIPDSKVIQCHGSFRTATCIRCRHKVPGSKISGIILAGGIPQCEHCLETENANKKRQRANHSGDKQNKRRKGGATSEESDEDEEYELDPIMKPDITFFGESLPNDFHQRLTVHDKDLVDLVIVIGTSLMVSPVSHMASYIDRDVPQIYISREICRHTNFDIDLLGECDIVCAELSKRAGLKLEHAMLPEDLCVNVETREGFSSRHHLTLRMPSGGSMDTVALSATNL